LKELSALRIVEIGGTPYVKRAFPEQTAFFSTFSLREPTDPAAGSHAFSLSAIPLLMRQLRSADLIVCQPSFFSPWHWRWLIRCFFDRRLLQGHFPLVRASGTQFLRLRHSAPVAVVDHEDIPVINRSNLFLLDRAAVYFKRELPVDRWRLFFKTAHPNLPTPRFRNAARQRERLVKIRPISLGLPRWDLQFFPQEADGKTVDVFFAGLTEGSSTVRAAGLRELLALREQGVSVDIPERRLPPEEFYARCARARLTWSPEGLGWECFRHYEAPMCGSVPVISRQTIERYQPLREGEHAFYYDVEDGNLSCAVLAALDDKPRLAAIAAAARAHVLRHHTPQALAEYIVRTTLEQTIGDRALS
jgi:hypothetical protein